MSFRMGGGLSGSMPYSSQVSAHMAARHSSIVESSGASMRLPTRGQLRHRSGALSSMLSLTR